MESIYETNPRFNTPIERNPMSESFFADLQKDEFSMVVKKYINSDDPLSDILKKIVVLVKHSGLRPKYGTICPL